MMGTLSRRTLLRAAAGAGMGAALAVPLLGAAQSVGAETPATGSGRHVGTMHLGEAVDLDAFLGNLWKIKMNEWDGTRGMAYLAANKETSSVGRAVMYRGDSLVTEYAVFQPDGTWRFEYRSLLMWNVLMPWEDLTPDEQARWPHGTSATFARYSALVPLLTRDRPILDELPGHWFTSPSGTAHWIRTGQAWLAGEVSRAIYT